MVGSAAVATLGGTQQSSPGVNVPTAALTLPAYARLISRFGRCTSGASTD